MNNTVSQSPSSSHNTLYFTNEEKRNMWIYYSKEQDAIFIFDPIIPTLETITLIDSYHTKNIYIVMTSCQKEKKYNTKLWQQIFDSIQILVPDSTFLSPEKIISPDTTYQFSDTITFFSFLFIGSHTLCISIPPYLFLSEIMREQKFEQYIPKTFIEFTKDLPNDTIVLSSFGPIYTLAHHELFIKKKLVKNSPLRLGL